MTDRQFAVLRMADRFIQALDARLANLPARPPKHDPDRCPRSTCGAELGPWTRGSMAGVRWRRCPRCDYREVVSRNDALIERVIAARKDRQHV